MSARDKLEDLMIGTYGMPDEKVLGLLDAYAHELAEKQRIYGHAEGMGDHADQLADLIDPEVLNGG